MYPMHTLPQARASLLRCYHDFIHDRITETDWREARSKLNDRIDELAKERKLTMDPLSLIQLAIQYGPAIKGVIDAAISNEDIAAKVKEVAAPLVQFLEGIGAKLFPKANPTLHLVGGVLAAFDPDTTKWLQGALNNVLSPSPNLVVDGLYGPRTAAAVQQFQKDHGLVVDGLAGVITQAALAALLTKSQTKPAAVA